MNRWFILSLALVCAAGPLRADETFLGEAAAALAEAREKQTAGEDQIKKGGVLVAAGAALAVAGLATAWKGARLPRGSNDGFHAASFYLGTVGGTTSSFLGRTQLIEGFEKRAAGKEDALKAFEKTPAFGLLVGALGDERTAHRYTIDLFSGWGPERLAKKYIVDPIERDLVLAAAGKERRAMEQALEKFTLSEDRKKALLDGWVSQSLFVSHLATRVDEGRAKKLRDGLARLRQRVLDRLAEENSKDLQAKADEATEAAKRAEELAAHARQAAKRAEKPGTH